MARGMDHNAHVPVPYDKIRRLWPRHQLKTLDTGIEIFRIRIFVGEAGSLVDGMHEMGTIVTGTTRSSRMKSYVNHRGAVLLGQRSGLWA